jgi:hypothetical protein
MLGRHIYRVTLQDQNGWIVRKDGDDTVRGRQDTMDAAADFAATLAEGDPPSKLVVEGPEGTILDERNFGDDAATSLERAADGKSAS